MPAFQVVLAPQPHEERRKGKRPLWRTDTTTQNHWKKNVSVSTTSQQQVPPDCSACYYSNTTTLSIAPYFQGHCSLKFPTGWTVKEKLFDLWNGSTKRSDAKGKRSARGLFPPCPVNGHWHLSFVRSQEFQVRRFFWNIIKFRHRECLKQEAPIFSWMILTLLQGRHSDGGFQNSVYHQIRSDSKTTQKRLILNCVFIKEG